MKTQKLLNLNDPPLCYHQGKTMLLDAGEPKAIPILPLSLPCTAWQIGTVRCNNLDYLSFWTTFGLERELKDFKNFYTFLQLHRPVDENTFVKIDKCWTLDHAKIDYFAWDRHCHILFQTPIAAWLVFRQTQLFGLTATVLDIFPWHSRRYDK